MNIHTQRYHPSSNDAQKIYFLF